MNQRIKQATAAVRSGLGTDTQHGAVVAPLHLSSNYTFEGFGQKRAYDYTRSGNPTRDTLADALTELEGGETATVTSSGMGALSLVCHLLDSDDLLIAPHDCYGGTYRLLSALAKRGHFKLEFANLSDTASLPAVFACSPRMVLVETPSNPLLRITDLKAIANLCQRHETLMVADNTFLSPVWQQPINYGADIVVHSTTKYLNGHSDVVGGAVIAADAAIGEELAWWANCIGVTGAPFDSFLTLRGVRTLHARSRVHLENATVLADLLDNAEQVRRVYYPGLHTHPGHDIARDQQTGYGAMISFEINGGLPAVKTFLDGLEHFFLAESLGGVESLIAHPASMTHAAMEPDAQATAGITAELLRLSVGIEHCDDLVSDVRAALKRVEQQTSIHHGVVRDGEQSRSHGEPAVAATEADRRRSATVAACG